MNIRSIATTYCPGFLRPVLSRIESSPIGKRLASGMFWSLLGMVISRGLILVASVFVARMLGKDVFGEYGMVRSTVNMFALFAGFGMGVTATKHVAEFRQSDPGRAGRIIGLSSLFAMCTGSLMALGMFVFAPWLAEHTINAPQLAGALRISALMLLINALNGAQTGALSGFEAFKTIAHVNLFVGLISFPILVAGAYLGGLTGAVWALVINFGVNWLLNHIALRKEARRHKVPFNFRQCGREWPLLWKFALPAVLAASMVTPVYWIRDAMLVNTPGGYGEMGILSAANQWYMVFLFIPSVLNSVVVPVLSDQVGQRSVDGSIKTLFFTIKMNLLIVTPLVLLTCIASPLIMALYGEQFAHGWPTMVLLLLALIVQVALLSPVGVLATSSGKMWIGFWMNCFWAIVFIPGVLLLINFGALGVAAAQLISFVLTAICSFYIIVWLVRHLRRTAKTQHLDHE